MKISVHASRLLETIKQLENLPADTSAEEVLDRISVYEQKLFGHLSHFGITGLQGIGNQGLLNYYELSLAESHTAEHVDTRLNGVAVLAPNSVSVELADLDALFPDRIVRTAVNFASDDELPKLQRVTLSELRAALPQIEMRCCFGQPGPNNLGSIASFDDFLAAAGKSDPLKKWEARQAAEQREIEEYQARQQAAQDQLWSEE
jgi:hypothetical protein